MTAPKPETQALKAWCESTPDAPKYITAYMWMRRRGATVEETIERFSSVVISTTEKCRRAGIPYGRVAMRMSRKKETDDEAIAYFLGDTRSLRQKCKEAGVSYNNVNLITKRNNLEPEDAIALQVERIKENQSKMDIVFACRKYGVHYDKVHAYLRKKGCSPETAAKAVSQEEKLKDKSRPENNPLRKAWV